MKFGATLLRHDLQAWELPFDYNLLKRRLEDTIESSQKVAGQRDVRSVKDQLDADVAMLVKILEAKSEHLDRRHHTLLAEYGLPDLFVQNGLNEPESADISNLLEELKKDCLDVLFLCRLAEECLIRMDSKLHRSESTPVSAHSWSDALGAVYAKARINVEGISSFLRYYVGETTKDLEGASVPRSSLRLKLAQARLQTSEQFQSDLYDCITYNRDSDLVYLIENSNSIDRASESLLKEFLTSVLVYASICKSWGCSKVILNDVMPRRGISIDAQGLCKVLRTLSDTSAQASVDASNSQKALGAHILSTGSEILNSNDELELTPLHYIAKYGIKDVAFSIRPELKNLFTKDPTQLSCLRQAVINNHQELAVSWLATLREVYEFRQDSAIMSALRVEILELMVLAVAYRRDLVVNMLFSAPIMAFGDSEYFQVPLIHKITGVGRVEYLRSLMGHTGKPLAVVNARQAGNGPTPLMIASLLGHSDIVKFLLELGADETVSDDTGWTAREHAVFRGHFATAQMLSSPDFVDASQGPAKPPAISEPPFNPEFTPGQYHAIVDFGATQGYRKLTAIDIEVQEFADTAKAGLLYLEISTNEPESTTYFQKFPLFGELLDKTMIFPLRNPSKAKINFKLCRATDTPATPGELIGAGSALLSDERKHYGNNRESLVREQAVSILAAQNCYFMGTVTFTSVMAKPFPFLKTPQYDVSQDLGFPRLVGHRGLGMNVKSHEHLQLGENTVQSFVSASNLGATIVEFDVQVTRDLVPILLHNYALSETGTDIPVHELSLEQFMFVSKRQSPQGDPISTLGDLSHTTDAPKNLRQRVRSRSETRRPEPGAEEVRDRMKYTIEYMHRGFKANTRGDYIQDTFATLAQALRETPEHIGFNIEIKYPRRWETTVLNLAPVVLEINTFVDSILHVIHTATHNKARKIILSSFTPDICILLRLKQRAYPVFLISNVGKPPVWDKELRSADIQMAVRTARQWRLEGVVFLADAFVMCPRLVTWVKNRGLVVGTYGTVNSEVEKVKLQLDAGVDLIFTDRVGLIQKAFGDRFVGRDNVEK